MSKALIPFLVAGDPDIQTSLDRFQALEQNGADRLEVGIPFNDPIADGPTIQRAIERSLSAGFNLEAFFTELRNRAFSIPITLFTYLNPIYQYGIERFAKQAKDLGIDSALILDLPFELSGEMRSYLARHDVDLIALLTPNTGEERTKNIVQAATGFIYYVSRSGVTGEGETDQAALKSNIEKLNSTIPVYVGFGIRTPAQAAEISKLADGVVVGSALVEAGAKAPQLAKEMKKALL